MHVIVHIGTYKTGSTSIQNWLQVNADRLAQDGIYYSRVFAGSNARKIAVYAADLDVSNSSFRHFGIFSADQHEHLRRETADALRADIAAARGRGCDRYVISSEYLSNGLTTVPAVERLRALLYEHADQVTVLCFLRPQVDLLVSRLATQARVARINPFLVHCPRTRPIVDYLGLYRRWTQAFPDAVRLIPYKRSPSVISPICRELNIDADAFRRTQPKNTRLDRRAARISHNINSRDSVRNTTDNYLRFYAHELPCEYPVNISRCTAVLVHIKYVLRNRYVAKLSGGQVTASDLRPRFASYPIVGNVLYCILPFDGAPMLRYVFKRFNEELVVERARSRIAEAELAALKGNASAAATLAQEALNFVEMAERAPLGLKAGETKKLRRRIETIEPKKTHH